MLYALRVRHILSKKPILRREGYSTLALKE